MNLGQGFSSEIYQRRDLLTRINKKGFVASQDWQEGFLGADLSLLRQRGLSLRRYFFVGLIICSVLAFVFRLFSLQVIEGSYYLVLAEENRVFVRYSSDWRGKILSSDGQVLAKNKSGYQVSVLYSAVEDEDFLVEILSPVLEMSAEKMKERFLLAEITPFSRVILANNIDHSQQIQLEALSDDLSGIFVEEGLIRDYPAGIEYSAILGYTGRLTAEQVGTIEYSDYRPDSLVGKEGLEKFYENDLRGKPGEFLVEVNAQGKELRIMKEKKEEKGLNLVTSLNSDWQTVVYEELSSGIKEFSATGGAAIFQDIHNGRILSLVSSPTFDNQLFAQGISFENYNQLIYDEGKPLFNRSISGVYPPGSVVKPIVAVAGLESGIITEETRLSDYPQIIRIGPWEFADWTVAWNRSAHGIIDVRQAIALSCDTFFYKVGGGYDGDCEGHSVGCHSRALGVEKISDIYRRVGFGAVTGIDLSGENSGLVPDAVWKETVKGEPWFLGNTYHLSIGQGDLLVSPLQIVNYISALANGGDLFQPSIGLRWEKNSGEIIEIIGGEKISDQIASDDLLEVARSGMKASVDPGGIIFPLRNIGVEVAAKTGTAEFGVKNAEGDYETHAWVTGFFPYVNPQYSFVILLEAGGQSNNSAEVASRIIQRLNYE